MTISSVANNKVKSARALGDRKQRLMRSELLIEGGRFIAEALEAGAEVLRCFYTETAQERWELLLGRLERQGSEMLSVTDEVMASLGDTVTPQGLVAVARPPKEVGADIFTNERLVLVADRISDPGNLGTMLRTAAALGASVALTTGCVDLTAPKVVRASAGAMYAIGLWSRATHSAIAQAARAADYRLVVCDAAGASAYYSIDLGRNVAIVVGNEAHGPAKSWQAADPIIVHIPMPGRAESLNAGVAAAIVMYEHLRQRTTDSC